MQLFRARVDLRIMTKKRYSTFSKVSGLEPHYQMQFIIQDTRWEGSYPSAEMQSVYCIAPADWATHNKGGSRDVVFLFVLCFFIVSWGVKTEEESIIPQIMKKLLHVLPQIHFFLFPRLQRLDRQNKTPESPNF